MFLTAFWYASESTVTSSASDSESDPDVLLQEVLKTFGDQLGKADQYFLQIKDADWGSLLTSSGALRTGVIICHTKTWKSTEKASGGVK